MFGCAYKLLDTKKAETVGKFVCSFYFLGTYGLNMLFNIFSLGVANQAGSRLSGREGIAWLTADAQPGDCLLFHYSGHGGRMPRSDGIWAANSRASLFPCWVWPKGFETHQLQDTCTSFYHIWQAGHWGSPSEWHETLCPVPRCWWVSSFLPH